jgi:transposase InsO family protein
VARAFSPEGRAYVGLFEQLFFDEQDVLCRRILQPNSAQLQVPLSDVQRRRTCLLKHLWETAIEYVHERTAHQGAAATAEKLRNAFFFPFMKKEVAEMVEACEACQMKTHRGANDQRHTYATTSWEGYPFQRLSIDLVGPFPMSPEGYTHLLTVRCTFSKCLEAFPLKDEKATSVVEVLEREMFYRYGPPEGIHSNNGCQFTSCLLKKVGAELGITLTTTPAYNPKSNPVERSH